MRRASDDSSQACHAASLSAATATATVSATTTMAAATPTAHSGACLVPSRPQTSKATTRHFARPRAVTTTRKTTAPAAAPRHDVVDDDDDSGSVRPSTAQTPASTPHCRVDGMHAADTYTAVARELDASAVVLDAVVCTHRRWDNVCTASSASAAAVGANDDDKSDGGDERAVSADVLPHTRSSASTPMRDDSVVLCEDDDADNVANALVQLDNHLCTWRTMRLAEYALQGVHNSRDVDDKATTDAHATATATTTATTVLSSTSEAAMQARLHALRVCEQDRALRRINALSTALTQRLPALRHAFASLSLPSTEGDDGDSNGDVDDAAAAAAAAAIAPSLSQHNGDDKDTAAQRVACERAVLRARAALPLCETRHWLQSRVVVLEEQQAWRALLLCAFAQRACVYCVDDEAAQRTALVIDEAAQRAAWLQRLHDELREAHA